MIFTGENKELRKLGALMDYLGGSRLNLLFELLPKIEEYINNPEKISTTFRNPLENIFKMWDTLEIVKEYKIDLNLLARYSSNASSRWVKNAAQFTSGEALSNKNTHEGIDYPGYLETLNARHLSAIPWMLKPFRQKQFASIVDMGGGAGTLIKIIKDNKIAEKGYLVDKPDMLEHFQQSKFISNADKVIPGNLIKYQAWMDAFKIAERPTLFVMSDVLHGRSLTHRKHIYEHIWRLLDLTRAFNTSKVKGKHEFIKLTFFIREFIGFSPMDAFLFDIQLKLFTEGQALAAFDLIEEMKTKNLEYQCCYNTGLYHYGQVTKKETKNEQ